MSYGFHGINLFSESVGGVSYGIAEDEIQAMVQPARSQGFLFEVALGPVIEHGMECRADVRQ